jgi:hypothetical protein
MEPASLSTKSHTAGPTLLKPGKTAKKRRKHGTEQRPPLSSISSAEDNLSVAPSHISQVSPSSNASVDTNASSIPSASSAGSSPLILPSKDEQDLGLSSPTPPRTPERDRDSPFRSDPRYAYSDKNESLPFASRKKNSEFHQIFKDVPVDDWLLEGMDDLLLFTCLILRGIC